MQVQSRWGLKLAQVVLMLAMLSGCGSEPVSERVKPDTVPQAAVWVGGADGGVYIHSSQASEGITIYYENGEIWYNGKQVLTEEQLQNATGWDGTTLYFKNGNTMQLME